MTGSGYLAAVRAPALASWRRAEKTRPLYRFSKWTPRKPVLCTGFQRGAPRKTGLCTRGVASGGAACPPPGTGTGISRHRAVQGAAFLGITWYSRRNFSACCHGLGTEDETSRQASGGPGTEERFSRQTSSGPGTEGAFSRQATGQTGTAASISRHAAPASVQRTYFLGRPLAKPVQALGFLDTPSGPGTADGFSPSSGRASSCGRMRARWRPAPRACQWWRPRR